jgi:hypothetical protein
MIERQTRKVRLRKPPDCTPACARIGAGEARGSASLVAPIVSTSARCSSSPSAQSARSENAGASSVTPHGKPAEVKPAGTAIADRSIRLTKFV